MEALRCEGLRSTRAQPYHTQGIVHITVDLNGSRKRIILRVQLSSRTLAQKVIPLIDTQ